MDTKIVELNNKKYYLSNDLQEYDKIFFYGCDNTTRNIIKKKNISEKDYCYAYNKKDKWIVSNNKYARAKLFISVEWSNKNIAKLLKNKNAEPEEIVLKEDKKDIKEKRMIEVAPNTLILKDNEKLKNINGEILDIEVRGERHYKKCYFKSADVSKVFEIKNLNKQISDNESGYLENIHYKIFTQAQPRNPGCGSKKEIFLTYGGLIRCLYVSRNKNADKFQNWANEIIFTIHMGTQEQKEKLTSDILGIDHCIVKEFLKCSVGFTPCVYLFTLNTVKNLRKEMNIPIIYKDDAIVCKFGKTNDLNRRANEHIITFGKIKGCSLKLKHFCYIDPKYITRAEMVLKTYFTNSNSFVVYKNNEELVIIESNHLKNIKMLYDNVYNDFGGEIKNNIDKMEKENQILQHKNELLEERNKSEIAKIKEDFIKKEMVYKEELNETKLLNEKMKNTLLKKELEYMRLTLVK